MKRIKVFVISFLAIAASITACTKGSTGPQGAIGPAGQDSVIHSAVVPLNMSIENTYTDSSGNTDTIYYQAITASAITQTILDSGLVIGYISFIDSSGGTTIQNAAPFFDPEAFVLGEIDLTSINNSWANYKYRYIVVPGEILTTNSVLKNYTKEQLKLLDYSVVSKALNIVENKKPN